MTGYPIYDYESLKEATEEYGEVHLEYEEVDYEPEVRKGQAIWHDDAEAVSIEVHGDVDNTYLWEKVVHAYCPQEYKH